MPPVDTDDTSVQPITAKVESLSPSLNTGILNPQYRRYNDAETEDFHYFVTRIMSAINPTNSNFKQQKERNLLSDIFSVAGEAFVLILIYNEHHVWRKFCDSDSGSRNGWMEERQELFSDLCDKVVKLRNQPETERELEEMMREKFRNESSTDYTNNKHGDANITSSSSTNCSGPKKKKKRNIYIDPAITASMNESLSIASFRKDPFGSTVDYIEGMANTNYPSPLVLYAPVPLSLLTDMLSAKVTHVLNCFPPNPTNPSEAGTVCTYHLHCVSGELAITASTTHSLILLMALYASHLLSGYSLLCKTIPTETALKYLQAVSTFFSHFDHDASRDAQGCPLSPCTLCLEAGAVIKAAKCFESVLDWRKPFTIPMLLHYRIQHANADADSLLKSEWCQLHAQRLLSTHRLSPTNNPVALTVAYITLHDARDATVPHTAATASPAMIMGSVSVGALDMVAAWLRILQRYYHFFPLKPTPALLPTCSLAIYCPHGSHIYHIADFDIEAVLQLLARMLFLLLGSVTHFTQLFLPSAVWWVTPTKSLKVTEAQARVMKRHTKRLQHTIRCYRATLKGGMLKQELVALLRELLANSADCAQVTWTVAINLIDGEYVQEGSAFPLLQLARATRSTSSTFPSPLS
eukprot:jgi/Psemu1/4492/gm1.4492_g